MSETPERIEREMFEIRSRMAPDATDLRKHLEPKYVGEQVKTTARERLKKFTDKAKERLLEQGQQTMDAASHQLSLVSVAIQKRDASQLTAAVKKEPRPVAVVGALVVLILLIPGR